MKDTEAALRKEWSDLFDRIMAFGVSKGQKTATQEITRVMRGLQTGDVAAVQRNVTTSTNKNKKRTPVKKLVAKALKNGTSDDVGMTPPEIRDFARKHFNKELRTESIRQALVRMDENGEAYKNGRGWHFGARPERANDDYENANPEESADNERSSGFGQHGYSGGRYV